MAAQETPIVTVRLPAELRAAADRFAKRQKIRLGELIRQALAEKLGRPDLAGAVEMGRPRKAAAQK